MFHLKAMLIDRKILIFGSSNFDFVSYYCEQEVVMVSQDENLVSLFCNQVLLNFQENSRKISLEKFSQPLVGPTMIKIAAFFLKYYANFRMNK